ncbi:MAG: hypothetical protein Hals2KO_19680 [Halioglobus sp.]
MNTKGTDNRNTNDAFKAALGLVNAVIHDDDDEQRQEAAHALQQLPVGKPFGVAVFANDPAQPRACYELRFNGAALEAEPAEEDEVAISCRVSRQHLDDVCDSPDDYFERPAEAELVWLMSRLAA